MPSSNFNVRPFALHRPTAQHIETHLGDTRGSLPCDNRATGLHSMRATLSTASSEPDRAIHREYVNVSWNDATMRVERARDGGLDNVFPFRA